MHPLVEALSTSSWASGAAWRCRVSYLGGVSGAGSPVRSYVVDAFSCFQGH